MNRGDTFPHPSDGGAVKVMAVADGYAMCRRPGCLPFVMQVKERMLEQPKQEAR